MESAIAGAPADPNTTGRAAAAARGRNERKIVVVAVTRPTSLTVALASVIVSFLGCTPMGPSCAVEGGRSNIGPLLDQVSCNTAGSQLRCLAIAHTSGPYGNCPKSEDVTRAAIWILDDANILRMTGPGVFEAVGVGDTFLKARWQTFETYMRPVSVFPGMPPMPTGEIFGGVYRAGQRSFVGAIDGATVEVLTGLVAGKSATTGMQPRPVPGFIVGIPISPGHFRILGAPAGTYRVRASKEGYVIREQEVTVREGYSAAVDFDLTPE